jgi:hypothetical protein
MKVDEHADGILNRIIVKTKTKLIIAVAVGIVVGLAFDGWHRYPSKESGQEHKRYAGGQAVESHKPPVESQKRPGNTLVKAYRDRVPNDPRGDDELTLALGKKYDADGSFSDVPG